jgi:hypothetical protein
MTAMESQQRQTPRDEQRRFEQRDAPARLVAIALVCLFVGMSLSAVLVAGLLALLPEDGKLPPPTAIETRPETPPPPVLEVSPKAARLLLEKQASERLATYEWMNRQAGFARIPIDRAMDLLTKNGWPDKTNTEGTTG